MNLFDKENSIEPGPKQTATPRKVEGDEGLAQERGIKFSVNVKLGTKTSKTTKDEASDGVAKQHGFYTAQKLGTTRYYTDYQQKSEVMRANSSKITTKLNDRQTVGAMLDLAQSRGWNSVKLRGTEDFKREAWVQAQVRGLETEGYRPKATDLQEADRRKVAAAPVETPAKQATAAKQQARSAPVSSTPDAQPRQAPRVVDKPAAQAVWGDVEKKGQRARKVDSTPTSERQASVSRSKASEAA